MNVDTLLSSNAKQKVIETLFRYREPIHMRRIIDLSSLMPRSVQLALKHLCHEKIIKKFTRDKRELYILNNIHPAFELLKSIHEVRLSAELTNRAKHYPNLYSTLSFMSEARTVINSMELIK